eukprot:TRINITY_DN9050_c0_g1_i1.p1 TRINITY_DN9050_c0_g1~~TRINITY_DN9050_c0_g1_i1.p1  ORF type:complete len:228 (-),score=29.49 TRINITY_DN9050_c0_g1_i1:23-706(-)
MNFVLPEPVSLPEENSRREEREGEAQEGEVRREEVGPRETAKEHELEKPHHYGHAPFGGFVILGKDQTERDENGLLMLTTRQPYIVSYCIGDYVAKDRYEIVTAWSHNNYRGLGCANKLYLETIRVVEKEGVEILLMDIITGAWDKITRSNSMIQLFTDLGLFQMLVPVFQESYQNETREGKVEQFMRLEMAVIKIMKVVRIYEFFASVSWPVWVIFFSLLLMCFNL